MEQEKLSYEEQKASFETSETYKLPKWSRKTFICMWPLLFVLVVMFFTQTPTDRVEALSWFGGVMVFCMIIFKIFDGYFE